jgi:hypothetical protein
MFMGIALPLLLRLPDTLYYHTKAVANSILVVSFDLT